MRSARVRPARTSAAAVLAASGAAPRSTRTAKRNVLPSPGLLSTVTLPRMACATRLTNTRPRPAPHLRGRGARCIRRGAAFDQDSQAKRAALARLALDRDAPAHGLRHALDEHAAGHGA